MEDIKNQDVVPKNENVVSIEKTGKAKSDLPSLIATILQNKQLQDIMIEFTKAQVSKSKADSYLRYALGMIAVCGGIFLSYHDKLDPTIGVLLGSVIGYMFSMKDS